MAELKNQHFVPRVLLKPFSVAAEGRAINLYTIKQRRMIANAPLKSQCARDYIYGKDGTLERGLATIEGAYSRSLRRVIGREAQSEDLGNLAFFAYLQLRRTEMAALRMKRTHEQMHESVHGPGAVLGPPPFSEFFMARSLLYCFQTADSIQDLKVRIIENRTNRPFVISDDPAVLTNKWVNQRLGCDVGWGIQSSGVLLTMPLAPRFALLCYDKLVYTIPHSDAGRLALREEADVEAVNELQYLKAGQNIYFEDWSDRDYVKQSFDSVQDRRTEEWARFQHHVEVGQENGATLYQPVTYNEARKAGRALISMTFTYPTPARWLSHIKFRDRVKTFYNGTSIGHMRKREWLQTEPRGQRNPHPGSIVMSPSGQIKRTRA